MSSVIADHEVEVGLTLTTTDDDVQAALARSGIVVGSLIGEALIADIRVCWGFRNE